MLYIAFFKDINKKQAKSQAEELLDLVNLKEHTHDKISSFLGGMKQCVHLVQALLGDPSILILDEPTASMADYIADIDGINLAKSLLSNSNMEIIQLFYNYFMNTEYGDTYSSARTQLWITRVYENYSNFKEQSDYLNQDIIPNSTFKFLLNRGTTVSDEAYTAAHTVFNNYALSCLG